MSFRSQMKSSGNRKGDGPFRVVGVEWAVWEKSTSGVLERFADKWWVR